MAQTVRFLWNGIRVDGKLYRAFYSAAHHPESGRAAGGVTVYIRDYMRLPMIPGLYAENDSDILADYIVPDTLRIMPDNRWYPAAKAALEAKEAHRAGNAAKRIARRAAAA